MLYMHQLYNYCYIIIYRSLGKNMFQMQQIPLGHHIVPVSVPTKQDKDNAFDERAPIYQKNNKHTTLRAFLEHVLGIVWWFSWGLLVISI